MVKKVIHRDFYPLTLRGGRWNDVDAGKDYLF